nr:MAG TPA: hypothetical protein [Caudoviricetes sp.]
MIMSPKPRFSNMSRLYYRSFYIAYQFIRGYTTFPLLTYSRYFR